VMKAARDSGSTDLQKFATAVTSAGYSVAKQNGGTSQELHISTCRRESDKTWIFADEENFETECGGATPAKLSSTFKPKLKAAAPAASEDDSAGCEPCCTGKGEPYANKYSCKRYAAERGCVWDEGSCVHDNDDDDDDDDADTNLPDDITPQTHALIIDAGVGPYLPTTKSGLTTWMSTVGFFTYTDVSTGGPVLAIEWSSTARRSMCDKKSRYAGTFKSCDNLPGVKHSSYSNTKFDRGHHIASGDGALLYQNTKATFSVCNIVPQTGAFNRGNWQKLEYATQVYGEGRNALILTGSTFESIPGYDDCICAHHTGNVPCGSCTPIIKIPTGQFKVLVDLEHNVGTAYVFLSTGTNSSYPEAVDASLLNHTSGNKVTVNVAQMFRPDYQTAIDYINKYSKVSFDMSQYKFQSTCPDDVCAQVGPGTCSKKKKKKNKEEEEEEEE